MYTKTTNAIKITVAPSYIEEHSSSGQYVWAYHVTIENHNPRPVQLIGRHWLITDSMGTKEEVKGPGVIGEQPILKQGESFEYTSGTHLRTDSGIMEGTYQMQYVDNNASFFDVDIPAFSLDTPYAKVAIN